MSGEVTKYAFMSSIRAFISGLLKKPYSTDVPKLFKDNNISKKKLVNDLIQSGIIEKRSNIIDKSNSDYDTPQYQISYRLSDKRNFNDKIDRMYDKYFKKIDECDCGGCTGGSGGGDVSGATNAQSSGQYTAPINKKPIKRKTLYMTESQFNMIMETINAVNAGDTDLIDEESTTFTVGALGDYTANGLALKKNDPAYKRPKGKITVSRIK